VFEVETPQTWAVSLLVHPDGLGVGQLVTATVFWPGEVVVVAGVVVGVVVCAFLAVVVVVGVVLAV
jgi:hypothetical protein